MITNKFLSLLLLIATCFSGVAHADELAKSHGRENWSAAWINCPDASERDYGVFHFRKNFSLSAVPDSFLVHVSADNRYRLFVNGEPVGNGPARGDLYNWYYESIDLAHHLKTGDNIITAIVWNMGVHAPVAQISNQTAFLLQGEGEKEAVVNSNNSWKVFQNPAYQPCSMDNGRRLRAYMVIGPGDEVDGKKYPWGWEQAGFDDSQWNDAEVLAGPSSFGHGTDNLWNLVPRNIPAMEETLQRLQSIRRAEGIDADENFIKGSGSLLVPPNSKGKILIDQGFNTVAYPELVVSRGKGSNIKMNYAETLFDGEGKKGNRNEVDGKELIGNYVVFQPDGGEKRLFRPLWLRTFRYIELEIETADEPLSIDDFYGQYTGYPFKEEASFSSNDQSLKKIWEVGWRTARLCAGETYYDCPYYEQLQYEADTRIQALISLYVSGDDRLMRKALLDFHHSREPEGLTQGRYPSNRFQVIPPFSLWWISMVHDYWMHRQDDAFLRSFLGGITGVLDWYEKNIDSDKQMLGPMKWWNFVDYTDVFPNGVPDGATDGNSSVITLQYVYALRQTAELFNYFGKAAEAEHYQTLATKLAGSTYNHCFDQAKGVMANTPEKEQFSQHASILAVLTDAVKVQDQPELMQRVISDKSLGPATFYYRFYLNQALRKAGMGDRYYGELTPWREMLENGLTTFAEKPDPARSDCHAWSASPNYDFLATICGVRPGAPGFREVDIMPSLGDLNEVEARIPHPQGWIEVHLKRKGKEGLEGSVTLPDAVSGTFRWKNNAITLQDGQQTISLKN